MDATYPEALFAQQQVSVNAVSPERTFLEKVFLLDEELAKLDGTIRVNRMSRHMYDIVMMEKKGVADRALLNENLYRQVIEHRRKYIGLKDFDYNQLYPKTLNIIPSIAVAAQWKEDYKSRITFVRRKIILKFPRCTVSTLACLRISACEDAGVSVWEIRPVVACLWHADWE